MVENGSGVDFLTGSSGGVDHYSVADVDSWCLRGRKFHYSDLYDQQKRKNTGIKCKSISRQFFGQKFQGSFKIPSINQFFVVGGSKYDHGMQKIVKIPLAVMTTTHQFPKQQVVFEILICLNS